MHWASLIPNEVRSRTLFLIEYVNKKKRKGVALFVWELKLDKPMHDHDRVWGICDSSEAYFENDHYYGSLEETRVHFDVGNLHLCFPTT